MNGASLTFEDILSAFTQYEQDATEALFAQGDVLCAAVHQLHQLGATSQNELLRAIGEKTSTSRRALMYRLQVARTFGPDDRHYPVPWNVYRVAAASDDPLQWVAYAADENLSADKLRQAIKHASGQDVDTVRIVFPLRNAEIEAVEVAPHMGTVTFDLAERLTVEQAGLLMYAAQLTVSVDMGEGD